MATVLSAVGSTTDFNRRSSQVGRFAVVLWVRVEFLVSCEDADFE